MAHYKMFNSTSCCVCIKTDGLFFHLFFGIFRFNLKKQWNEQTYKGLVTFCKIDVLLKIKQTWRVKFRGQGKFIEVIYPTWCLGCRNEFLSPRIWESRLLLMENQHD